jgi:ADP-heptose:LPS heptosyltransferase
LKPQTNTRNVLAINFGGLGDEVLFLPTLQTIKLEHPQWRITLLTEPRGASIAQITDLLVNNLVFDIKKRPLIPADYIRLVQLLRGGKFDVVVSSGSSPQVSALLFLSGISQRVGFRSNRLAQILLTNPVVLNKNQHAALMYHDLTHGLSIERECPRPQVTAQSDALTRMKQLLEAGTASNTKKVAVIHPGTSRLAIEKGVIKTWSPDNWAQLIRDLIEQGGCQVVLAGGPDDAQTVQQIVSKMEQLMPGLSRHAQFFNAFGKTANLQDLVALISLADLLVCVDSAPMHLGVALNTKMVALFGPTDPAKLLWRDSRFVAIRDQEAAKLWGGRDPFAGAHAQRAAKQPQGHWGVGAGTGSGPGQNSTRTEPYVQIPPDTVFRTAMDQLNSMSNRGSSPEFPD